MKRLKTAALIAFALATVATTASAGKKTAHPVVITATSAEGQMADARSAPGIIDYIGCKTTVSGNNDPVVTCSARRIGVLGEPPDAPTALTCTTESIHFLFTVATMTGDSFIRFEVDPKSGECTLLEIDNASDLSPRVP